MKRTKAEIARENGAKSKGPNTPEGKARSSQNAIKHGFVAYKSFVLDNENLDGFVDLCLDIQQTHNPVGGHENHLAWQIAGIIWRERRLWATEVALLDLEIDKQTDAIAAEYTHLPAPMRIAKAFQGLTDDSKAMPLLIRYQSRLIRQREGAMANLRALQAERFAREAAVREVAKTPAHRLLQN